MPVGSSLPRNDHENALLPAQWETEVTLLIWTIHHLISLMTKETMDATQTRPRRVRNGLISVLLLGSILLLLSKTQPPNPTMLRTSASESGPISENMVILDALNESEPELGDEEDDTLGKQFGPPYARHGTVRYSSYDDDGERVYKRTFSIPCGYGIMTFNVGPAPKHEAYDFEVYDNAYLYSDNNHLCLMYPHYKGYQTGPQPFWMPSDPTQMNVPLGRDKVSRISTKINAHVEAKPIDDAIRSRGGDYVIMAHGHFWDPRYYDNLKSMVHGWTKDDNGNKTGHSIEESLANWVVTETLIE